MSDPTLSEAITEAYATARRDVRELLTLEVSSPANDEIRSSEPVLIFNKAWPGLPVDAFPGTLNQWRLAGATVTDYSRAYRNSALDDLCCIQDSVGESPLTKSGTISFISSLKDYFDPAELIPEYSRIDGAPSNIGYEIDFPLGDSFALCIAIKRQAKHTITYLQSGDSSEANLTLYSDGSYLYVDLNRASGVPAYTAKFNDIPDDDTWRFITVSFNPSGLNVYLGSELLTPLAETGSLPSSLNPVSGTFKVKGDAYGSGSGYTEDFALLSYTESFDPLYLTWLYTVLYDGISDTASPYGWNTMFGIENISALYIPYLFIDSPGTVSTSEELMVNPFLGYNESRIPDLDLGSRFSVSIMVWDVTQTSNNNILYKGSSSKSSPFAIYFRAGRLYVEVSSGESNNPEKRYYYDLTIATGESFYVSASFSPENGLRVSLNGVILDMSHEYDEDLTTVKSDGGPFMTGGYFNGVSNDNFYLQPGRLFNIDVPLIGSSLLVQSYSEDFSNIQSALYVEKYCGKRVNGSLNLVDTVPWANVSIYEADDAGFNLALGRSEDISEIIDALISLRQDLYVSHPSEYYDYSAIIDACSLPFSGDSYTARTIIAYTEGWDDPVYVAEDVTSALTSASAALSATYSLEDIIDISEASGGGYLINQRISYVYDALEAYSTYTPLSKIYIVKDRKSWDLTLETEETVTFEPVPFTYTLPTKGDAKLPELTVSICDIDRRVSSFIERARASLQPIYVTLRIYLSNDTTAPQNDPPLVLELTDSTSNKIDTTIRASVADIVNKSFPNERYTRTRFPNLGG